MSWYFFGGVSAYWMGAVGTRPKPFRVLRNPWVVGRGLKGDVERDLDAPLTRFRDQALKVVEAAELGMRGRMTAFGATDCPRNARIRRALRLVVVGAFA